MLFYPGGFSMTAVWLVAMIVLLIIEGIVPGLVSIWFAIGAFAAMISAILGAPLWLQVLWFFAVSILTLCLTRPFAKKYVNSRRQPTNADRLIGMEGIGPHYEIVVTKKGFMDQIEVKVELTDASLLEAYGELEALTKKIHDKLKVVLQIDAKVTLVSPNTLKRFEGKAKRVTDLR